MKKMIAFAIAASLTLGSMGTIAYGSNFADINDVTWKGAITFIDQAASLGLMSGYNENGKKYCKPRNNVTYCEAVQLMYSILKVYNKQDVSSATVAKWKPVMSGVQIPEWAYNATAYALENGILNATAEELNNLRGGTKNASREAVGLLFGRALATIDGYSIDQNATLSYKDAAKISQTAKPYLDLLNRSSLMVGDTNNNFNPQNNINRAEMAVLSVKAYQKLSATQPTTPAAPQSGTVAGTVINCMVMTNGDLFLSVKDSDGMGLNLFADADTVTPIYKTEKIKFANVGVGDTVKVSYKDTQVTALEVTNSVKGIQTAKTYELVKLTGSKVTVQTTDGKEESYRLLDDVSVLLEEKKSTISKVQDAMDSAKYDVTLTLNADGHVEKLEAKKNANNPTKGTLTALDESDITIQVGSRKYTFPLADDLTIEQDSKTMTFTKLKNSYKDSNYTVSLKLDKNNKVTKITIQDMEDETNGTLTYLNSRRITIKAGSKEYTYDVDADKVVVKIDGKSAELSDLRKAFNDQDKAFDISLEVDRDNYATRIVAKSKNADAAKGSLTKLTSSKITIRVDKKDIEYNLAKDVSVKINGKRADLEDLKDNYKDINYTVKLEFDKNDDVSAITAEFDKPDSGQLKDIDEKKETITVISSGIDMKLRLDTDADITLDGKDVTLSKLNKELDYTSGKNQIKVGLKYNRDGDVIKLTAEWQNVKDIKPEKGELKDVNTKKSLITVVDNDGDSYDYNVARDVVISYSFSANTSVLASSSQFDKSYKDYDEDDLEGLSLFFRECWKNNSDCTVNLTIDSDGEVSRIKARAE